MKFYKQSFPINKTGLFSSLIKDYFDSSAEIHKFYKTHFLSPELDALNENDEIDRNTLVEVLRKQSKLVKNTTELSRYNIEELINKKTYTITTGHQLCLFTGPLYFIYKIIGTIQSCYSYKNKYPDLNFVPVYWMASEDHDFEEVNHAYVFGNKITWESKQKGCVGDFNTEELSSVISNLSGVFGESEDAQFLIKLFQEAYLHHTNLADATRYIVNALFGKYGIVVLDGNDASLKSLFKKEIKADLFENKTMPLVNTTISKLKNNYDVQVTPREINFFYREEHLRERLEKKGDGFIVINTDLFFSKPEIENLIDNFPERFSPNVVTRPLYQQKILPNVGYVGGPGELAYWLEYKTMFIEYKISFPVLIPRPFIMVLDKNIQNKMKKFDLMLEDLFNPLDDLIRKYLKNQHSDIDVNRVAEQIDLAFNDLLKQTEPIDKTLAANIDAEKQKTINAIKNIEQKITRALKKKEETSVDQLWSVKEKLFPNNIPQERFDNFSMYVLKYGTTFIDEIMVNTVYSFGQFNYTVLSEI